MQSEVRARRGRRPASGTQSLIPMIAACWRRPGLLLLELAWRWGFGIPALVLLGYEAMRVLSGLPLQETGLFNLSLGAPVQGAQQVSAALALALPPLLQVARWLAPILVLAWAIASGLGRNLVLRRLDPEMHSAPVTLVLLQLLRILGLATAAIGWWLALRWAAGATLNGAEPNLVGYFAWAICLSLSAFIVWALLSWILSIAPMVAMLEGAGVLGSLARSVRLGPLSGKLVEVNLTLGIIKLALAALAIIGSSIPLPFKASMVGGALYLWWAAVSVIYLIASDFFQVARLAVFVQLWREDHKRGGASQPDAC